MLGYESIVQSLNRLFLVGLCMSRVYEIECKKDVELGLREENGTQKSVLRLPMYEALNTHKIDVTNGSPEEVADYIIHL